MKSLETKQGLLSNSVEENELLRGRAIEELFRLIIHGEKDTVVPVETIRILENQIKNNTTIIYKNSGHSPMIEEPERFNDDVLKFLKGE